MLLVLRNKKKLKIGRGCVTEEQVEKQAGLTAHRLALPYVPQGHNKTIVILLTSGTFECLAKGSSLTRCNSISEPASKINWSL